MNLTETHAKFWQERKATPRWVLRMRVGKTAYLYGHRDVSVDACVNAHARIDYRRALEVGNMLATLRLVRKRGPAELHKSLLRMYLGSGGASDTKRRRATAFKWLKRLQPDLVRSVRPFETVSMAPFKEDVA